MRFGRIKSFARIKPRFARITWMLFRIKKKLLAGGVKLRVVGIKS